MYGFILTTWDVNDIEGEIDILIATGFILTTRGVKNDRSIAQPPKDY